MTYVAVFYDIIVYFDIIIFKGVGGGGNFFFKSVSFIIYVKDQLIVIPKWAQPAINSSRFRFYGCLKLVNYAHEYRTKYRVFYRKW